MNAVWPKREKKTLVSDLPAASPRNALYTLAAIGGALLGLLLIAAAYGHFSAVWPKIDAGTTDASKSRFVLLLPGLVLAITGLVDIALGRALGVGMRRALRVVLICNVLAALYLTYLLNAGVPDHPIGFFTTLLWCYVIVLGALQAGLVWPTVSEPR